ITRDASFNARDALISPSAAITLRGETGGKKMKRAFTSLISTRSTLIPQSSVALSFPRLFLQSWKHRIVQNVLLS
uniref:Uncharacterized protein n=1 Tax=Astatotilapia calliptera TaxID=8154 RepID=A0AAX7T0N0_ASTCA